MTIASCFLLQLWPESRVYNSFLFAICLFLVCRFRLPFHCTPSIWYIYLLSKAFFFTMLSGTLGTVLCTVVQCVLYNVRTYTERLWVLSLFFFCSVFLHFYFGSLLQLTHSDCVSFSLRCLALQFFWCCWCRRCRCCCFALHLYLPFLL